MGNVRVVLTLLLFWTPTWASLTMRPSQIFTVPPHLRSQSQPLSSAGYARSLSLDDVFPGSGLGARWESDEKLRRWVRVAMRHDLFTPDPKLSEMQNKVIRSLGSSLMVGWKNKDCTYGNLSMVFDRCGVQLDGNTFMSTLTALSGGAGSLIDIANTRATTRHSWHQDSGLMDPTVMLGFPPSNGYHGEGVFSHCVRLSHPLIPSSQPGAVVEWEQLPMEALPDITSPSPGAQAQAQASASHQIPEEFIERPIYGRGEELLVYSDAHHLHSAPDKITRESVWRFM